MDKAVRGLVEGRYEWIAFTSVNAVRGGAREVRGVRPRRPRLLRAEDRRRRRQDRRTRSQAWGLRADLVPVRRAVRRRPARGLAASTTSVLDPINRVFLPRADIATENLVAGLVDLGWECDDVTAYRTVRAAPPPAPTRDAIKTGKFDAVVFTSSSTVRNLVGIAGKPHPSTVIAVIGPATAKTAEEHGLRVDVLAPKPRRRGARRRARRLRRSRAGSRCSRPASRSPSRRERKPSARRKASIDVSGRRGRRSRWSGRGGCAAPRRCGGWSPRPRSTPASWCCRCSCARGPPSRARSPPCRASSSTPGTRCGRRPPRRPSSGLGGVMLFGVPEQQGRRGLRGGRPRPASSTSRSPTWSPRWATRSP